MTGKDHKKELKALYTAKSGRIDEVDAPRLLYLAIDGVGDPSIAMGAAMGALFSIAYPLKFAIQARDPRLAYVVMPPEGLFPGPKAMYQGDRTKWRWTLLVLQPVKPTAAEFAAAVARAKEKGVAEAARVELRSIEEGHCVQTLHLGPYANEHETIEKLHAYMGAHHLRFAGPHHEVYLSDPLRAAPAKLKTILRQPVSGARVRVAAR